MKFTVDKALYNKALRLFNEVVKTKNQQTIKKNETTILNNEMNKIMKEHKLMNKKLEHAKNIYQQTINEAPKLHMFYSGAMQSFIVKPLQSHV